MNYHWIFNISKLPVIGVVLLCISLMGCEESNKSNASSVLNGDSHPSFVREKVATSNHYKPTGQISDATPEFIWPKTQGATQYLLGHEDAETSTRWHQYILTAEEANCSQATDSSCSYTPDDMQFEQHDEKAWWIKPYIPGSVTQWSNTHVFTYTGPTTPPPSTVLKPISPSSKTATSELNPAFVWSLTDNASKYQIGFEDTSGMGWGSFIFSGNQANCGTNECSYELSPSQTKFKQGDIKTWWIRSFTHSRWGEWSIGSTFNIDTSSNPVDLLVIKNDDTNEENMLPSKADANFVPHYSNGSASPIWGQGFAVLDNGFYLMSKNIKVKNSAGKSVDRYITFNLFDKSGKSIANAQLDYASHGQDLSVEKIANNHYYVYTSIAGGKGIARFILNTESIDFNNPSYIDIQLDITFEQNILLSKGSHATPTLNEDKDTFAVMSYKNKKVLYVETFDKSSKRVLKTFELDLNHQHNGSYNQGIAMKGNLIYILRGHWLADGDHAVKKLYIVNANTGELVSTYSFSLQNSSSYERIEPEGLTIMNGKLFVMLPIRKNTKRVMKLYKLLDI